MISHNLSPKWISPVKISSLVIIQKIQDKLNKVIQLILLKVNSYLEEELNAIQH